METEARKGKTCSSQNAGVQAGSCQSSQDSFFPALAAACPGPKVTCRPFPQSSASCVHRALYLVEAHLAPVRSTGSLCPAPHVPPKVMLSLQFLQPLPILKVLSGSPSMQPLLLPPPHPGMKPLLLRALTCFILGSHVVVFKVDPLPSGFREEQSQCVHTQVVMSCLRTRLSGASHAGRGHPTDPQAEVAAPCLSTGTSAMVQTGLLPDPRGSLGWGRDQTPATGPECRRGPAETVTSAQAGAGVQNWPGDCSPGLDSAAG